MTALILTILYWYGLAASAATVILGLWCWRQVRRQNAEEKLRHSLGYRANVKGWRGTTW